MSEPHTAEKDALVWVPNNSRHADTVHRAGCAHLRLSGEAIPLAATSPEAAEAEIAGAMGWEDYPADESGMGFEIHVSPCVTSPGE